MAHLTSREGIDDTPDLKCSDCGAKFWLYWQNNGFIQKIEYCPFCGVEIDSVKPEED